MKKLIALVLALALVLASCAVAFADVTITVNRDSTFQTGADGNRDYHWYRVFTVVKNGTYEANGGGYTATGAAGDVTEKSGSTATAFAYTASLEVANKLGTYSSGTWTAAENQVWFKLTPIAGTSPQTFSVEWINNSETSATAQNAAKWLFDHQVWDADGNLPGVESTKESDGDFTQWAASGLTEGYYLLKGTEGQNLIAATTNISVNEKNSYPTVDKKEKDTADGDFVNGPIGAKIGDTIYYQVEVKVPADANANIVVADTMSTGLTYGGSVVVRVGDSVAAATTITNENNDNYEAVTKGENDTWTWKYIIKPTTATKGKYVVFTFAGTVNADALTSTNRKNDVEINYNNGHYVMPDTVDFDIAAAAIIKYDGATADLVNDELTLKSGATAIKYVEASFALKDSSGNAVNVSEATTGTKGVYVVDAASTSNIVTSDKTHDGIILIYGLDPDVTYTLTETGTEAGYNRLENPVTLTTVKAEKSNANTIKVVAQGVNGITAGNASADGDHTLTLTPAQVRKVENNQGTVLPSTGGIGTTIFYILGGLLVVGAAVILVARRKASN